MTCASAALSDASNYNPRNNCTNFMFTKSSSVEGSALLAEDRISQGIQAAIFLGFKTAGWTQTHHNISSIDRPLER